MINITDVDEFTDPVPAPNDGDPANGATFQASPQALANRTRYILNRCVQKDPDTGNVAIDGALVVGAPDDLKSCTVYGSFGASSVTCAGEVSTTTLAVASTSQFNGAVTVGTVSTPANFLCYGQASAASMVCGGLLSTGTLAVASTSQFSDVISFASNGRIRRRIIYPANSDQSIAPTDGDVFVLKSTHTGAHNYTLSGGGEGDIVDVVNWSATYAHTVNTSSIATVPTATTDSGATYPGRIRLCYHHNGTSLQWWPLDRTGA